VADVDVFVREMVVGVVVVVQGEADLFEVVGAAHAVGGLADLLHGGQEQANQDANNGDDDQQFNQGKPASSLSLNVSHCPPPQEKRRKIALREQVLESRGINRSRGRKERA